MKDMATSKDHSQNISGIGPTRPGAAKIVPRALQCILHASFDEKISVFIFEGLCRSVQVAI